MKMTLRVILGALVGVLGWALAFFVSGALTVAPIWPHTFRKHHFALIGPLSQIVVVIPCVVVLGILFRRMFGSHRTSCAIAAMAVALLAESLATMFPPGSVVFVVLPFLLGPAAVASLPGGTRPP